MTLEVVQADLKILEQVIEGLENLQEFFVVTSQPLLIIVILQAEEAFQWEEACKIVINPFFFDR